MVKATPEVTVRSLSAIRDERLVERALPLPPDHVGAGRVSGHACGPQPTTARCALRSVFRLIQERQKLEPNQLLHRAARVSGGALSA